MMNIKEDLLLRFINFLIKSLQGVVLIIIIIITIIIIIKKLNKIKVIWTLLCQNKLKNYTNQLLENLKKRKVYSGFKDNNWGADLADMQFISKFNKGFRFLLRVIDFFSKYAWVIPLKDKKGVSIVDASQKILKESDRRKPNKIWVHRGS